MTALDALDPLTLQRPGNEPWFVADRASQRHRYERCLAMVRHHRSRHRRAVDLGCGHGHFTRLLAPRSDQAVGVDRSIDSVRAARGAAPYATNASYQAADILHGALGTGSCDLVCALEVLYYFEGEDRVRFIRELRRIVADDGLVLVTVNAYGDSRAEAERILDGLRTVFTIDHVEMIHREWYYRIELPLLHLLEDLHYLELWRPFHHEAVPRLSTRLAATKLLRTDNAVSRRLSRTLETSARTVLRSHGLFAAVERVNRVLAPARGRNQLVVAARPR